MSVAVQPAVLTAGGAVQVVFMQGSRSPFVDLGTYGFERLAEVVTVRVLDAADGAQRYQFNISFHALGGSQPPPVDVRVFRDSFAAFADLAPFFEALADRHGGYVTPEVVMGLLRETVGAIDVTTEVDPHG